MLAGPERSGPWAPTTTATTTTTTTTTTTHHHHHHDHHADRLRARMLERGVITRAIADHSLTFCPPLITTDRPVDQIIDTLGRRGLGVAPWDDSTSSI